MIGMVSLKMKTGPNNIFETKLWIKKKLTTRFPGGSVFLIPCFTIIMIVIISTNIYNPLVLDIAHYTWCFKDYGKCSLGLMDFLKSSVIVA